MKRPLRRFLWCRISCAIIFLITTLLSTQSILAQTVTTGKSFVNITRPNGGTFLPGDILEIRATIAVTGGNATNRVNSIRYNDTINLAKLEYITGSLQMISNEGRLQYPYTDGADTDSANIDVASGRLRFNIGNNAAAANVNTQGTSTTNAGRLWGALRPNFFGGTCIRVYAYRVRIRNTPTVVAIDTLVNLSAGNFRYSIGVTNYTSNFPVYRLRMSADNGLCENAVGGNAILGESGGTFGSGVAQNRAGGTTFVPAPYTFNNFAAASPNDNFYGLANRTSANGSTDNTVGYGGGAGSAARVHNVWEIIGDHTGAADPIAGNPATNTGYAVIINASYQTNRAFTQNITGVCEETYYEFSAWFRNICRRCGCDSSGRGASQTGFVPGPGNDSAGVRPNLNFEIDGEDYYTSGNIAFTGQWVKKGFIFKTKPGQTSFTVTIRNNAPGGGGNDWAIDDITVATCLPNMTYSPTITPNICTGGSLTLRDTVRSFFNNYVYYKWQRSTNNGVSWNDITGSIGPVATAWNGTAYEYVSSYTVPPANTTLADSGDKYRLVVGTSPTNISSSSCQYTDVVNPITLNVLNCLPPLTTKFLAFTGNVVQQKASLKWTTTSSSEPLFFDVEKSTDGGEYLRIATVNSHLQSVGEQSNYIYTDPADITTPVSYRIVMRTVANQQTQSRVLQLSAQKASFDFITVVNPFRNELLFDISSGRNGLVKATLLDHLGNPLKVKNFDVREGVTTLTMDQLSGMPTGIYLLRLEMNGHSIHRKVMKQ